MYSGLFILAGMFSVSRAETPGAVTFGILPYFSAAKLMELHKPLKEHLSGGLNEKVSIISAPDFKKFRKRTREGAYDLVFTAPHMAGLAELEAGYQRVVMSTHRAQKMEAMGLMAGGVAHDLNNVRGGEYAVLAVSDEGSGISPGDLERIFEPFYTKKVMGRSGTGLGLAVVWNTVQDHKGYVNVTSSPKGTVFALYFPITRKEVAMEEGEVPPEDFQGQGEKILVVDDEERQREIASGILTKLGYVAEAVSSGEEAIEYVKEHPVDLMVLDMVMPKGINGRQTYEEIIRIRPGQKAVIASGYSKTREVDISQELGAGKYLRKPYTLAKLGIAVKEELEKQAV